MADIREDEREGGEQEPQGAAGGEDVIDDPIIEQAAIIFRGYVIECIKTEEPSRHVCLEDLGGKPNEQEDPNVKQAVQILLEITHELNSKAELKRLINQVDNKCTSSIFMKMARNIFADGITWGRLAALYHLASRLILKALTTDDLEMVREVISWVHQVLRDQLYFWLTQQKAGVICGFFRWTAVAMVASVALVAAIVYYRQTR